MTILAEYIEKSPGKGTRGGMHAMAEALMEGDAAKFKAGYTAENAVIAVIEQAEREGIETDADDRRTVATWLGADLTNAAVAKAIGTTKPRLEFGCTRGLPETVRVAWGARLIAPDDLVYNRQGCAGGEEGGPERAALLEWLSAGAGEKAREFCRAANMGMAMSLLADGRSQQVIPLYEDERGKVVGSPQGSHGYVYIAAWLFEHDTADGRTTAITEGAT